MSQDQTRKLFIQMSGAPGSGKSTLAKHLRRGLGGFVIDHDILRSALLEDKDLVFETAAKQAYRVQWALAEDAMNQGLNVIVDSPCNFQEAIDRGAALTERHGFDYWYVECRVKSMELLEERLRARKPMRSQRSGIDRAPAGAGAARDGDESRAIFERWMKEPCRPARNVITVDSTISPETNRDFILKMISRESDGSC